MCRRLYKSTMLIQMVFVLIFTITFSNESDAFGYDSANACSPNGKLSRRGRAQLIKTIPCDLSQQAFCNLPGSAYPWHAVRRFVHENQGLMKRMYGDVRHISILRDEIQNNEIDIEDVEVAAARYSKDGGARRSSKFMHMRDDFGGIKNNDILKEPHFRPVATRTGTTTTTPRPTNDKSNKTNSGVGNTAKLSNNIPEQQNEVKLTNKLNDEFDGMDIDTSEQYSLEDDSSDGYDDDNLESNSVYSAPTLTAAHGDNIQMVEPPKFGLTLNNLTQAATISTTLKKVTNTQRVTAVNDQLRKPQRQHPIQTQYQQQLQKKQQQQQHHHNYQIQQQHAFDKVNITILKESSNVGIKSNESERITNSNANKKNNNTSNTTPLATAISSSSTATKATTPSTSTAATAAAAATASQLAQQAIVKGGAFSGNNASTSTPLKSSVNKSTYSNNKNDNGNGADSTQSETTTTTTTTRTTSILTTSSPTSASSPSTPQSLSSTSTTRTTTTTKKTNTMQPTTASLSSSSTVTAGLNSSIKPQLDLLLGEKVQKPTTGAAFDSSPASTPATPPSNAMPATKPVLRDGQLFQDTVKQEAQPVLNARGVNACPVKEEVVAPFWANNTRGEVLALLNLYPFEQYVHWEKCLHEHKQMYCRDGCRCEQQYRLHRLLAYDPHNECRGIFSDWFRFPSSCICKCYDIPLDFRATSRSPRSEHAFHNDNPDYDDEKHPIEKAEEDVKNAIYAHATEDWYRPRDDMYSYED